MLAQSRRRAAGASGCGEIDSPEGHVISLFLNKIFRFRRGPTGRTARPPGLRPRFSYLTWSVAWLVLSRTFRSGQLGSLFALLPAVISFILNVANCALTLERCEATPFFICSVPAVKRTNGNQKFCRILVKANDSHKVTIPILNHKKITFSLKNLAQSIKLKFPAAAPQHIKINDKNKSFGLFSALSKYLRPAFLHIQI